MKEQGINTISVKFTEDVAENMKLVSSDIKLHTLIAFSAMLLKKTVNEILDLAILSRLSHSKHVKDVGLFEMLKMISKIKP